jgi:hypothetical protein
MASEKTHATKSMRDANLPPHLIKWAKIIGAGLLVLGLMYGCVSSLIPEKTSKKEEVWIIKHIVTAPDREGIKVRDFSMGTCRDLVDTEFRFEMTCKNEWATAIFEWKKLEEKEGRWWHKGNKENVYGSFTITKEPWGPEAYQAFATMGSGRKATFRLTKGQ